MFEFQQHYLKYNVPSFHRYSKVNSSVKQFKNDCEYLINEFLIYSVEFGSKFNLVDFEVVMLDSTTIEASVDEYYCLKY